jgi:sec-independent protein translocase protein TatA
MIGTLGTPEMIFIFLLALVLFGPKELPELGRKVGRALTEFRRASNELKSTFDQELRSLEAETNLGEVRKDLQLDTYNYDYSAYDHNHNEDGSYIAESYETTAENPSTESVSAAQDADSPLATEPEGVIARGTETQPLLLGEPVEEHPSQIPPTLAETAAAEQNT